MTDQQQLITDTAQRQRFFDQFCNAWQSEYRQRGGKLFCSKGCSGCCSLVVNCTLPEALQVADSLQGVELLRLDDWIHQTVPIAATATDFKLWLAGYRSLGVGCPFLDQGGCCSVYPIRPLSCRSLLSTKEPVWCVTDFCTLDSSAKQTFMASLDRSAVAFPTHYGATPQELGRELEEATLRQMETVYGFSLFGALPWLVWLERTHRISSRLAEGQEFLKQYLQDHRLANPYLLCIG